MGTYGSQVGAYARGAFKKAGAAAAWVVVVLTVIATGVVLLTAAAAAHAHAVGPGRRWVAAAVADAGHSCCNPCSCSSLLAWAAAWAYLNYLSGAAVRMKGEGWSWLPRPSRNVRWHRGLVARGKEGYWVNRMMAVACWRGWMGTATAFL